MEIAIFEMRDATRCLVILYIFLTIKKSDYDISFVNVYNLNKNLFIFVKVSEAI